MSISAPKTTFWRSVWFEWLLLTVVVLVFCGGVLDLGEFTRLPGNDAETIQMLDWTLIHSLSRFGRFPLWNPYIF